jgi:serine/threonine-protein kinase HipA
MSNRKAKVFMHGIHAGDYIQDDTGYHFRYMDNYLIRPDAQPISLTLPLEGKNFDSLTMIPFFDGLIPEGWLLDIAVKNWKINPRDRMELLLRFCKETIGAVSIEPSND